MSQRAHKHYRPTRTRRTIRFDQHPDGAAAQVEAQARQFGGVREAKLLELAAKIRGAR